MLDLKEREEAIQTLYETVLERAGDEAGVNSYLNSNLTLPQIERSLKESGEYLILNRRKMLGDSADLEFITQELAVSCCPKTVESFKKMVIDNNIHGVIILSSSFDLDLQDEVEEFLLEDAIVGSPISVSAVKNSLSFIEKVANMNKKTVVCCDNGMVHSTGMSVLWLIKNGFDLESASLYVQSQRTGAQPEACLIGPWHIKAAESLKGS